MLRCLTTGCLGTAVMSEGGSAQGYAIQTNLEALGKNQLLLLQSDAKGEWDVHSASNLVAPWTLLGRHRRRLP